MTNNNVNITVKVKEEDIEAISSFNIKNNLVNLELNHLPFNKFNLEIYPDKKQVDEYQDKERLRSLGRMIGVSDEHIERSLNDNRYLDGPGGALDLAVSIKNNTITVLSRHVFEAQISFTSSSISTNDLNSSADGYSVRVASKQMQDILDTSPKERESFDNFVIESISNILRLLIYMSSDTKISIPREDLFESKTTVSKANKKKKKNGKKSKGSAASIIRNIEYKIPKERVIDNIEKHTPRKYERQTSQWFVKGYWRKYKSGKMVWIEPKVRKARGIEEEPSDDIEKEYIVL